MSLFRAANEGNLDEVRNLLKSKAVVNATDASGRSALHYAAKQDSALCLSELLAASANVDARNRDRETALHWAAVEGKADCYFALIEAKANPDSTDDWGKPALDRAHNNCKITVAIFLSVRHSEDSLEATCAYMSGAVAAKLQMAPGACLRELRDALAQELNVPGARFKFLSKDASILQEYEMALDSLIDST